MALSADLWDSLVPPEVWITVGTLAQPEHDFITVNVRVKEAGRRSVSAQAQVSRYAPTDSVILAVSKAFTSLTVAQAAVSRDLLGEQLRAAVRNWVDPF
jgi:hypothetical protein